MYPHGYHVIYQVPHPGDGYYIPASVPIRPSSVPIRPSSVPIRPAYERPHYAPPQLRLPVYVAVAADFSVPPPGVVPPPGLVPPSGLVPAHPQLVPCVEPLASPPAAHLVPTVSSHPLKATAEPFIPKSQARSASVSINPPGASDTPSASACASNLNPTDACSLPASAITDNSAPSPINPLLDIDDDVYVSDNPHPSYQGSDYHNEETPTYQQHPPLLHTPQQHHPEKAVPSMHHPHYPESSNGNNEEYTKSTNYTKQHDVVHKQTDVYKYPSKSLSPGAQNTRWNQNERNYYETQRFSDGSNGRRYHDGWKNQRFPRRRGYFQSNRDGYSPSYSHHYNHMRQEYYNRNYKYCHEEYFEDEYEDYEQDGFEGYEKDGYSMVYFNHEDTGCHDDTGYHDYTGHHRRSRGRGYWRGARGSNSGHQESYPPPPQHDHPAGKRYSQSRKKGENPINKPQDIPNGDTTEQFSKGGNSTKQTSGQLNANDNFSRKKATRDNNNAFNNKVQNNLGADKNNENQNDRIENSTEDTNLFPEPSSTQHRLNTNHTRPNRNQNINMSNGKKRYDQTRRDNNNHDRGSNDTFVKDSRVQGSNHRSAWRGSPSRSNVAPRHRPVLDEAALERQANNKRNARKELVILDEYNSDLNLKIQANGYGATASGGSEQSGFKLLWADIKATHGVLQGRVYFEVKVIEAMPGVGTAEESSAVVRVGWSPEMSSFRNSKGCWTLGYKEMSQISYEEIYEHEDVLGAMIDLDSIPPVLSFIKNGEDFGESISLNDRDKNLAMFPHISLKNCKVRVNFGQRDPWYPPPEGFEFIGKFPIDDLVPGQVPPEANHDCEVIMLIGLPGCGKTTWAVTQQREHPEKRYCILGPDLIMDKMDAGNVEFDDYRRRFKKLSKLATDCFNKLLREAAMSRRNYIIDQTNVYSSAREKKLKGFFGFTRRAVVIQPSDKELQRRAHERSQEHKKHVPELNVREMKANFRLPEDDSSLFDSVEYVELQEDDARELVEKYNISNMHYDRLDMD